MKKIEKIDIILFLLLILLSLIYIDFIDINEKLGFPINVIDEPLLILTGIILGYFIAKLRFLGLLKRTVKKL